MKSHSEHQREGRSVSVIHVPRILGSANSRQPEPTGLKLDAQNSPERKLSRRAGLPAQPILASLRVRHRMGRPEFRMPAHGVGPSFARLQGPQGKDDTQDHAIQKQSKHDIMDERPIATFSEGQPSLESHISRKKPKERMVEPPRLASFGLARNSLELEAQPADDPERGVISCCRSHADAVNAQAFERPLNHCARRFGHEALPHTFDAKPISEIGAQMKVRY
jgi:hypothetical protein